VGRGAGSRRRPSTTSAREDSAGLQCRGAARIASAYAYESTIRVAIRDSQLHSILSSGRCSGLGRPGPAVGLHARLVVAVRGGLAVVLGVNLVVQRYLRPRGVEQPVVSRRVAYAGAIARRSWHCLRATEPGLLDAPGGAFWGPYSSRTPRESDRARWRPGRDVTA